MELTELCRGSFASDFWGIQEFPLPWLELATSDGVSPRAVCILISLDIVPLAVTIRISGLLRVAALVLFIYMS